MTPSYFDKMTPHANILNRSTVFPPTKEGRKSPEVSRLGMGVVEIPRARRQGAWLRQSNELSKLSSD